MDCSTTAKRLIGHRVCLALASAIILACHSPTEPEPPVTYTHEPTVELYSVIWTGEWFVAVGDAVYTSEDGITWTPVQLEKALSGELIDISYANGKYVAVGEQFIAVSDDLTSWTYEWRCHDYRHLMSIARSADRYVISGYRPKFDCPFGTCLTVDPFVLSSADGEVWNGKSIGNDVSFSGVVWTGSQFVGVAGRLIVRSADGVVWDRDSVDTMVYGKLSWTGRELVCMSGFNTSTVYSFDGRAWTERGSVAEGTGMILADTLYVAVGRPGRVSTSVDLDTWVLRHEVTGWPLYDVVWNGQMFVAVGNSKILTSPDGVTWTEQEFI